MRAIWNSFKVAFSMYSKIPMPESSWEKEDMRYSMCFFPLVGVVIGFAMEAWYYLSRNIPDEYVILRVVILMLIPVAITGGIHMDGYLDTCDALSSWQTREKRLEILQDSRSGAFAVIMGCLYFLLSFGVYNVLISSEMAIHGLCLTFMISRTFSAQAVVSFPMAKDTGLAATFSSASGKNIVKVTNFVYCVVAIMVLFLLKDIYGSGIDMFYILGVILTWFYYRWMSWKNFGGITGDLAGWFLQVSELVSGLIVALLLCFQ